jgi:hypothetical protein
LSSLVRLTCMALASFVTSGYDPSNGGPIAESDWIGDSTAQRVDAFVLIMGRIGLLVGLARHRIDSTACSSIPVAQKNGPETRSCWS